MYAVNFCYWLQGAFELASVAFDETQVECIRRHLALVDATPQNGQPKQALDFCAWLRGGLDFMTCGDAKAVGVVQRKLNDCFEHAIDGMYQADQNKLNATHQKPSAAPGNPTFRC